MPSAAASLGETDVLDALQAVKQGRLYDLAVELAPGMPQWDGHPTYMMTTYRTPHGLRNTRDVPILLTGNEEQFTFMSELMVTCMHVGTHIDALCHILHEDEGWHGGGRPEEDLGDFGALKDDAAAIPLMILRATLLDAAGHAGVERLPASTGLDGATLQAIEQAQGTPVRPGTAAIIRTGAMSVWGDRARFNAEATAGPDLDGARWLTEGRGAVLVGSDTPTIEQIPSATPTHPHPVHDHLIRKNGVHMVENMFLEQLAAERVYEFTLIVLPLRVKGATGSLLRPVAIT